jgi:mono/diheme cytochrome c family protein
MYTSSVRESGVERDLKGVMPSLIRCVCAISLMLISAGIARAAEDAIKLKEGAGRELLEAQCVSCHSLDYVLMNSPFLDRKGWEASINKMIKVMGAPVTEADAKAIIDYLEAQYGKK